VKHNFRELKIWKDSMSLVKEVYLITQKLPMNEKFGLISQINRSAVSIPSNIAEGSGRSSEKEFTHFLNIAISSSFELETQLILIFDLFEIETSSCIDKIVELQKMISGFKKSLIKINN
jgi:four helix bundle protein